MAGHFCRRWDEIVTAIWVGRQDLGDEMRCYRVTTVGADHGVDPVLGAIDPLGSEGRTFVSVRSVNDGDMDEGALGKLDAAPALDEVSVDNGLELEKVRLS